MKTALHALAIAAISIASATAESIGINFIDSQDVSFGAAEAGAPGFAQENWNHFLTDWSGNADNDALFGSGVVDSEGNPVGATLQNISYAAHSDPVHYDARNTWRSGAGNADANATLMNGYLDDGNDNQPYLNVSLAVGSYTTYSVVVYVNGDGQNGAVGRYWLEEWTDPLAEGTVITDRVGISDNSYSGSFVQAGTAFPASAAPVDVDVASGNYIVFQGITARNLRVRAAGNNDPEDFGRGPLNAVQIIEDTADSDDDGMTDVWETTHGLDPNDDQGENGADGNPDGDGLSNIEEFLRNSHPRLVDTDGDTLNDELEDGGGVWISANERGTSPRLRDSDNDGIDDPDEDNEGTFVSETETGTDPNKPDTDGDELEDGWEVDNNFDPNDDGTTDAVNGAQGNPDNDDSPNIDEFTRGTNPRDPDSDDDTVFDGHEDGGGVFVSDTMRGTDPLDDDSDDDTLLDGVETGTGVFMDLGDTGTDPNKPDTDDDRLRDDWEIANGRDPFDGAGVTVANGGIGINFGAGRANASLAPADTAGVAPQTNWNNASGAAGGPMNLTDQNGDDSGATLTWQTDEEWSVGGPGADADGILLTGWVSAWVSDDSNTIQIANIPYAQYDLLVYFNHDRATEDADFGDANGAFPTVRLHESNPDVTATEPLAQQVATADGDASRTGTFFYVPGLDAASLDLRLNAAGGEGSPDRGAITGIQIVASSEAAEFAITSIERVPSGPDTVDITIRWNSEPGISYGILAGSTLADFEEIDDKESEGSSTSYTEQGVPVSTLHRFYKIQNNTNPNP